eukprot:1142338-Pelagomonas_calceolata.AAC.10
MKDGVVQGCEAHLRLMVPRNKHGLHPGVYVQPHMWLESTGDLKHQLRLRLTGDQDRVFASRKEKL